MVASATITREVLSAGLLLRAGIEPLDKKLAERGKPFASWSLVDLARECCRLDGFAPPRGTDEILRRALTTVSLPGLFSTLANHSLMKGFQESPSTSLVWCDETEEPDFKTARQTRLGGANDLEPVNDAGEVEHAKPTEWSETYQLATYGRMLSLTRVDLINDSLRALTKTPRSMGFAARRLIDNLVYTHLLQNGNLNDSVALFHSSHSNLLTSAALASDKLGEAKAAMRKQTDLDGKTTLNIEPQFLIVPPELEQTALELIKSSSIVIAKSGTTDAETIRGSANVHQGSLVVIVEPRLSNSNYTSCSATSWYLACAPAQGDTVVVAYLKGQRQPTLVQVPLAANQMGVGFRIHFDVAVKALDFRGLVKNTA